MKYLLSTICIALVIALIGEYEARIGVEQELAAEVKSCDEYVSQHVTPCAENKSRVWSEGEWHCIPGKAGR